MKKYIAYAMATAAKKMGVVEAKSIDEAREKAYELDHHFHICHECNRGFEIGDVYDIEVELANPPKDGEL